MRQLTSLDSQFLALETPRQSGHVASVAILDTSTTPTGTLTLADIQALILERLPLLPPLRWRLQEVPLGLDYPYWVDDIDFDLDFHVRELALPAPGSDEQLAEQVARIVSRPLDRSKPLWETYVISGLESGNTALLTKIHHALIDGMSGAEILGLLLDLTPEGREIEVPASWGDNELVPGPLGMLARGVLGAARYPLRALRSLPSALPNLEETQFSTIPGASGLGRLVTRAQLAVTRQEAPQELGERRPAPKTSFSGRVSAHRRFTFGQLSLDDVKTVKTAYGVTVNDVIVSICAGAVRRWLLEHDELPADPLIAQIPVSVRTTEQVGTYGNRIMLMAAPLFTDEADPVVRLQRTHDALGDMKQRHRALPADLLSDANHFIPPAVFSRAARLTFGIATSRPGRPVWNLVISNVPGPQFPLYCAGARLVANYPVSVITDGMGLNITVMSYCGSLDFGIVADREQMPDVANLVGWLRESLAELEQPAPMKPAAKRKPRAKPAAA
ncbi:MAG TPA: wax ester/triacylglycerol synthase family O-acyltransferase [Solirubrobacteraceae bacterium]|nr:wax ester/triacylglycerol synthase family O-acyltransferase [Solirubrobacteraceae bacterium]